MTVVPTPDTEALTPELGPVDQPTTVAHEAAGPEVVGDVDTFPTSAELARTLVGRGGVATLSTLLQSGYPYASVTPYSILADGAPLICVSSLAVHTQNLRRDPRASILVQQDSGAGEDPLSLARVTLIGACISVDPTEAVIEAHLAVHPYAERYVGFSDFSWWHFEVVDLRYVGGFAVMGWSNGTEYADATPDPVMPNARPMIEHLDTDHADACLAIVRNLAGVADAVSAPVSAIDRYGLTFDAFDHNGEPLATARVAFAEPVESADDVRSASIELVRRAIANEPR